MSNRSKFWGVSRRARSRIRGHSRAG